MRRVVFQGVIELPNTHGFDAALSYLAKMLEGTSQGADGYWKTRIDPLAGLIIEYRLVDVDRHPNTKPSELPPLAPIESLEVALIDAIGNFHRENHRRLKTIKERLLVFFEGDEAKYNAWWSTMNPLLGGVSPNEMLAMGKAERLSRWIIQMLEENQR